MVAQISPKKMEIKQIIKDALAEKGYVVTIHWVEYSSCVGFDVDMNICTKEEAKEFE
jgi:hypothetical protein